MGNRRSHISGWRFEHQGDVVFHDNPRGQRDASRIGFRALVLAIALVLHPSAHARLLGLMTSEPTIDFFAPGVVSYDAATGLVTISATPATLFRSDPFLFGEIRGTGPLDEKLIRLQFRVSVAGRLVSGVAGPDLVVKGSVDVDFDGVADYDGVLLEAEVTQFGFKNGANGDDAFDLRLTIVAGALAPLYASQDLGLYIASPASAAFPTPFGGSFTASFASQAQGVAGVAVGGTPLPAAVLDGGTIVGMNLAGIADWVSQIEFVDLMKQARPWIFGSQTTGEWDSGRTIPLDGNGYPLQVPFADPVKGQLIAQTLVVVATGGHYPDGAYTLKIQGRGSVVLDGDTPRTAYAGPGTHTVVVTPANGGGLFLTIRESDPADPITEINLIVPGHANTHTAEPFYPPFLERLAGMKVLRFMDQMQTNNSPLASWEQRRRPGYFTQSGDAGIAPEYIADLSNRAGADAWISIPHRADDGYVRELARLLKTRLNPERKVYIEYSNEIWNNVFQQSAYASGQGALHFPLDVYGPYGQRLRFQARRSGEIFDIFEQEFGATSRLVRVIGGWAAGSWTSNFLLDALADPAINPSLKPADALAIGSYFGHEIADSIGAADQIDSVSVDEILDRADAAMAAQMVDPIRLNKAAAGDHGVRLLAYEGGQHLVASTPLYRDNQTLTGKLNAANRSPRMKDLYLRMLNAWFAESNDLFVVFSYVGIYGKWGSWGVLEWQDQDPASAPKFAAIQQFLSSSERVAGLNTALARAGAAVVQANAKQTTDGLPPNAPIDLAGATVTMSNGYPSANAAGLGVAANLGEPDPFSLVVGGFPAPPYGVVARMTAARDPAACYFLYLGAPAGGQPTLSAAVTGGC